MSNNISKSLLSALQDNFDNIELPESEKELLVWTTALLHNLNDDVKSKEFCEKFIFSRDLGLPMNSLLYLGKKYDRTIIEKATTLIRDEFINPEVQAVIQKVRTNFSEAQGRLSAFVNGIEEAVANELNKKDVLSVEEKRVIKILEKSLTSQPEKWRSERYTLIHEKGKLSVGSIKHKRTQFRVSYEDETGDVNQFVFESSDFAEVYYGFVDTLRAKLKEDIQQFEDHLIG